MSPKTCEIHSLAHTGSMKSWFVCFFPPYSQSSEGFPVYFAKPVKPQHPSSRWSKVCRDRSWNVEGRRKKCEGKVCSERSMSTYLSLFSGCSLSPGCPATSLSVWQNFTSCSLPQTPPPSLSHSLPLSVDMDAHVTVTAAQNSFMAASSGQWSYDS